MLVAISVRRHTGEACAGLSRAMYHGDGQPVRSCALFTGSFGTIIQGRRSTSQRGARSAQEFRVTLMEADLIPSRLGGDAHRYSEVESTSGAGALSVGRSHRASGAGESEPVLRRGWYRRSTGGRRGQAVSTTDTDVLYPVPRATITRPAIYSRRSDAEERRLLELRFYRCEARNAIRDSQSADRTDSEHVGAIERETPPQSAGVFLRRRDRRSCL